MHEAEPHRRESELTTLGFEYLLASNVHAHQNFICLPSRDKTSRKNACQCDVALSHQ